MVEALILSYNALPMDVVSSYRAKAYCDHLIEFGIKPTLLTHRWEENNGVFAVHRPNDKAVIEENEKYKVIRLPYPGMRRSPTGLHTLFSYIKGDLDVGLADSYTTFRSFLSAHLSEKRYHLVIAIYNPHYHLKLAYECWRKFNIPYVVDFRDLWDNEIVTPSYKANLRKRVINFIISSWWKKWIRNSLFFSTTGEKWLSYISRLSDWHGIVVRNGIDDLSQTLISETPSAGKKFKIIHFGRIYRTQDVDCFLSGFREFAKNFSHNEVSLEIVGLKKVEGADYAQKIKKELGEYVTFIPYMSKDELINYCSREAALFFFPNFKEDNGQFAVKLYDYVMAGRNIIVSPDGGDVSDFVLSTNTGVVLNTPEEVSEYLNWAYGVFSSKGLVPFSADWSLLHQYSRRNQVKLMADKIHSVFSETNG